MHGRTVEAVWRSLPILMLVTAVVAAVLLWRLPGARTRGRVVPALLTAGWVGAVTVVIGVVNWNPGAWATPLEPYAVRPWSAVPLRPLWRVLAGDPITTGTWEQMGGNLLLLAPLAVLMPLLTGARPSLARAALYAASASSGLELLQLAGRFGIADVDDVLLNTTGAALAYAGLRLVETVLTRRRRSASSRPSPRRTP